MTSSDDTELQILPNEGGSVQEVNEESLRIPGILVVVAGFICNFMIFGISFTFGVFQDFYLSPQGPLHSESPSVVSLIGTLATALTYMCGILHTNNQYLQKHASPRMLMQCGAVVMSMGLICTGFCNQLWQFIVTQGILFGIGSSMVYLPPVVCAPPYFSTHRGIAMGVIFSGTGIGGLVMGPLTDALISSLGWRWAVRILGFLNLAFASAASFMVKEHPLYSKNATGAGSSRTLSVSLLTSKKFILQILGSGLQSAGYLIPLVYMSSYARTLGYSESTGAVFIGVNNGVNALFKIILGYGADRIGRINMIVICCLISMASVFGLWLVPERGTYVTFIVIYGIFSGAIIALLPACLVELFGPANYKSMTGLMYLARGIGNMLGSPVAGLFVKKAADSLSLTASSYRGTILYNGAMLAGNCFCFLCLRGILFRESRGKWKA
jgi:MFS family permease